MSAWALNWNRTGRTVNIYIYLVYTDIVSSRVHARVCVCAYVVRMKAFLPGEEREKEKKIRKEAERVNEIIRECCIIQRGRAGQLFLEAR